MNDEYIRSDEEIRIVPNTLTRELILDCENIHLNHRSLDLRISIPSEKIESLNSITINGIKFIKEEN